jgi:hypothetical protein
MPPDQQKKVSASLDGARRGGLVAAHSANEVFIYTQYSLVDAISQQLEEAVVFHSTGDDEDSTALGSLLVLRTFLFAPDPHPLPITPLTVPATHD